MASREILVRLRAEVGNFRSDMRAAGEAARATGAAAEQAGEQSQRGIRGLMANAQANEQAWSSMGKGMLVAGAAIMVGVGMSIAKFAEFDKAMSSVDAATHETAGNMELLRAKAIEVGADTAFSAVEAAQGIEELAKAGVSTKDILNGGLAGALDLAAAGALGVGEASEIAATAMTQFGLAGSDIPHIADLLAAGAGKAQGSVQDMGMALKQAGLVASQTGLTIEETTGGLAAFAFAGLIGSDAGTSFKSMLQRLTPTSKESAKLMDELGISAYDAQGNFIGLENFAGNLQTSMADLTVEQRNAAMSTIFGSDAVRAASVIYENGADGVAKWIDNVNDAGYAAETAARMQDNLAGDIEKLGGAFDTLMIKSGTGPAEMLRGIVQAAEAAVDAVGKVPAPLLTSITIAAALVGGLLLLGGAFITIVPKIAATRAAIAAFNTASPGMIGAMKKIGLAAGVAGIAIIGMGAAASKMSRVGAVDVDQMAAAMTGLSKEGTKVNDLITGDSFLLANDIHDTTDQINGIGDALHRVSNITVGEGAMGAWTDLTNLLGGKASTQIQETEKAIAGMSDALAGMVQNGNAEGAAVAFSKIAAEADKSDVSVGVVTERFGSYQDALRKQAKTLGVVLTDEEYYQWMLGKTPPLIDAAASSAEGQTAAAEAMAQANEETATKLAEVGLAADGTVSSLGKLLESMFAAGLIQLSANEASIKWQESLEAITAAVAKNGQTLDITTAAGKENARALDGMSQAGISHMQTMAENNATQEQLQVTLKSTFDSLVTAAKGFGMSDAAADAYARKVLNIPPEANVDTTILDYAKSMAELHGVGAEADSLNGKTANVWINTVRTTIFEQKGVPYRDDMDANGSWVPNGRAMGGLVGFAGGGVVPGRAPLNPRVDNVLAMTQNGTPYKIRSGEMIVNEQATKRNLPLLKAINEGTYQAPSKSVSAGYSAPFQRSSYAGAGGSSAAPTINLTATVVNPFTGAEVRGIVKNVAATEANNAVSAANDNAGRRPAR